MATTLAAGDIAIIAMDQHNTDQFTFVLLKDVDASTQINFTTTGYDGSQYSGEGAVISWTSGTALAAGTVITVAEVSGNTFLTNGGGATTFVSLENGAPSYTLNGLGDQLIAFQGAFATDGSSMTELFGLHVDGDGTFTQAGWDSVIAFDQNDSMLPPGLTPGESAVAIDGDNGGTAQTNALYTGPTSGTVSQMQAAITDPANWTTSAAEQTPPTGPFTVTADPIAPIITLPNLSSFYTEGDPGSLITSGTATITDTDSNIVSMTISFFDVFQPGDTLAATASGAIQASDITFNAITGVLTVTGAASATDYTAVLNSVTYQNTSDDPTVKDTDFTRLFTIEVSDGTTTTTAVPSPGVMITGVDDAATAADDTFATDEATAITTGNVFDANPTTADVDPDTVLTVTAVNGNAASVGTQITLVSGALLTLNANGTFTYDPNGAFDEVPAATSGAIVTTQADSFSYQVNGGPTAVVTVNVTGLDSDGDIVVGTNGDDVLDGGIGADTMIGGPGNDRYLLDNPGDSVDETFGGGAGFDVLVSDNTINITDKTLFLGTFNALRLTGSNDANLIGDIFVNVLTGNSGSNVLNGLAGADIMRGFAGNDSYVIDNVGDFVDESLAGSSGTDRVVSTVSVDLTDTTRFAGEIERVDLRGSDDLSVIGNDLDNSIYGNDGDNFIYGEAGNDFLTGGAGADTFVFSTTPGAGNVDRITDFTSGEDAIWLDSDIFSLFSGGQVLEDDFHILGDGGAVSDSTSCIIYNDSNGTLFYDADGNGAGVALAFAALSPGAAITADDFTLLV